MAIEIHDVRIPASGRNGEVWEVAATVLLPGASSLAAGPDIFYLIGDASAGRAAFHGGADSQAEYYAGRGHLVVVLEHIGSGESSASDGSTLDDIAAGTHDAVMHVERELSAGTLLPGLGPVKYGALVAAGQGSGARVAVGMQANHQTFKGLTFLGLPGADASYAAKVEVPVLIELGAGEAAADAGFTASPEVEAMTETGEAAWTKRDRFVRHASTFVRRIQSTLLMEAMAKQQEAAEKKAAEMAGRS